MGSNNCTQTVILKQRGHKFEAEILGGPRRVGEEKWVVYDKTHCIDAWNCQRLNKINKNGILKNRYIFYLWGHNFLFS